MAATTTDNARFELYLPLVKRAEERLHGAKVRLIYGISSTPAQDAQGQRVIQKGINFEPLLESGFFNWNHMERPGDLLGEPFDAKLVEMESDELGMEVVGMLYEGVEDADDLWKLMASIEKNPVAKRRIGWSIQGDTNELQGDDIVLCTVDQLALTHEPANPFTWAKLYKSITKTMNTANATPMRMQDLDSGVVQVLWGDCKGNHYDESTGRFHDGVKGMFRHLVACKGMSADDAHRVLKRLFVQIQGGEMKDGRVQGA